MLGRALVVVFLLAIPCVSLAEPVNARPELVLVERSQMVALNGTPSRRNIYKLPLISALNADSLDDIIVNKEWSDLAKELCVGYEENGWDCSLNYKFRTSLTPNDAYYSQLWGISKIGALSAWDTTAGSSGVVVAVVDTGVDYSHPDLAENMWVNPGEIPNNEIDDDENGYIDDVHGYDFVNDDGDPMDDQSHGTHVSGTIGAVGDNSLGVVGVNWNVKIMAVKFLNSAGSGYLSDAVAALDYVTQMRQMGENIVAANNSWGSGGSSSVIKTAIEELEASGVVVVSAAGNEAANNDVSSHIPSDNSTISVAATDSGDNLATFSNYGATKVDLAAPGVAILSTIPGASYAKYSGTSMATPHVTGAVALVAAAFPDYNRQQLKDAILNNVTYLGGLYGKVLTGGRLNVGAAVTYGTERGVVEPIYAVTSVSGPLKWLKKVVAGRNTSLKVNNINDGDGVGTLNLVLTLDDYSCGVVKTLSVPAGTALLKLNAKIPKSTSAASVAFGVEGGSSIVKTLYWLIKKAAHATGHSQLHDVTTQDYSASCAEIGASIKLQSLK